MLTPAVLSAAGFLQDLESREGDFISLRAHSAIYSVQPCPQPHAVPSPCTDSESRSWLGMCPLGPGLRVAVLRSARPLGFVVGLKQRSGWHFRAGLTHGSSLAGGWQQGWGTAATFPSTNRATPGAPVWDSPWPQAPWGQSSQGGAWMWSRWSVPTPSYTGLCDWWPQGRKSPGEGERCS